MNRSSTLESDVYTQTNEAGYSQDEHSGSRLAKVTREHALRLASASEIQHLSGPKLLAVQCALQHGDRLGSWLTPPSMCPPAVAKAMLNLDIRHNIVRRLSDPEQNLIRLAEQSLAATGYADVLHMSKSMAAAINDVLDRGVQVCTRYLILLRIGPAGVGRKGHGASLKPSNTLQIGYAALPALVSLAASKWIAAAQSRPMETSPHVAEQAAATKYLSVLQVEDLDTLSASLKDRVLREADRMRILCERAHWHDVPFESELDIAVTAVAGERPRSVGTRKPVEGHRPLPDDYVSEMGLKSLWLIQELSHNLFTIGTDIRSLWQRTEMSPLPPDAVARQRKKELRGYLEAFSWRDSTGRPIDEPPFLINLFDSNRGEKKSTQASNARGELAPDDVQDTSAIEQVEGDREEVEMNRTGF